MMSRNSSSAGQDTKTKHGPISNTHSSFQTECAMELIENSSKSWNFPSRSLVSMLVSQLSIMFKDVAQDFWCINFGIEWEARMCCEAALHLCVHNYDIFKKISRFHWNFRLFEILPLIWKTSTICFCRCKITLSILSKLFGSSTTLPR